MIGLKIVLETNYWKKGAIIAPFSMQIIWLRRSG